MNPVFNFDFLISSPIRVIRAQRLLPRDVHMDILFLPVYLDSSVTRTVECLLVIRFFRTSPVVDECPNLKN